MKWFDALMGQYEVVGALALRETRTRFGAHQLGYAWALLEPSLMILTFYILFQMGGRGGHQGMDLFGFLCTGIIPYTLFTNTCTRVAESISGNQALLFYPQVNPLDLVIARTFLEFCTYTAVFMVLMGGNALYMQEIRIADPLLVVMGFVLACLLGAVLGLVFCALSQFSKAVDRARGPILRPFFWISGIFFTATDLPEVVRDKMLLNPVLHTTELTRAGWYESHTSEYAQPGYVAVWILGLLLVGLALERVVRRKIEVT